MSRCQRGRCQAKLGTLWHEEGWEQTWKEVLHLLESKVAKSRAPRLIILGVNRPLADWVTTASLPRLYMGADSSTTPRASWGCVR